MTSKDINLTLLTLSSILLAIIMVVLNNNVNKYGVLLGQ